MATIGPDTAVAQITAWDGGVQAVFRGGEFDGHRQPVRIGQTRYWLPGATDIIEYQVRWPLERDGDAVIFDVVLHR